LLNDEGFSYSCVKVFSKNFLTIDEVDGDIEKGIKSLVSMKVRYLRFKFRRPVVTFAEGISMLTGKMYKNVTFWYYYFFIIYF
jgi:hypothetical protein